MSYAHETCCAHLKIQYCREFLDGLTHDWWECASCKMLFAPLGRASLPQWIPISERLPTSEDADERGDVVWKWADSVAIVARWGEGWYDPQPVAWHPLPPYTPPKPGPTEKECRDLLIACEANKHFVSIDDVRDWFAAVTARIEREKGK